MVPWGAKVIRADPERALDGRVRYPGREGGRAFHLKETDWNSKIRTSVTGRRHKNDGGSLGKVKSRRIPTTFLEGGKRQRIKKGGPR